MAIAIRNKDILVIAILIDDETIPFPILSNHSLHTCHRVIGSGYVENKHKQEEPGIDRMKD